MAGWQSEDMVIQKLQLTRQPLQESCTGCRWQVKPALLSHPHSFQLRPHSHSTVLSICSYIHTVPFSYLAIINWVLLIW